MSQLRNVLRPWFGIWWSHYIHNAWASALLILHYGQCEGLNSGISKVADSRAFLCAISINNTYNTATLGISATKTLRPTRIKGMFMVNRHAYVGCDFNDDDVIWKYYTLPDFICLLQEKKLFFTRVDLASDPNEFPITEKDAQSFSFATMEEYISEVNRIKGKSYINCWRMSEFESFGMWKSYSDIRTGVAIKTTVKRLIDSCNSQMNSDNNRDITIGKVRYINNVDESTQMQRERLNFLYVVLSKTKPYENEQELRLTFECASNDTLEVSKPVNVNLQTLIQDIYIGAEAKPYHVEAIKNMLSLYGINVNVTKSNVK